MRLHNVIWLGLIVASASISIAAPKAPADPALQATYDHFVGTWIGTDTYVKHGSLIKVAVTLAISETQKSHSLRFDYVFGRKGNKNYERNSRFVVLDPENDVVTLKWLNQPKMRYLADGLRDFVRAGYGSVTFSSPPLASAGGEQVVYRCALQLTKERLQYEWETGPDGSPLQFESSFDFVRAPAALLPRLPAR